jgi:hypothetical protein
MTDEPDAQTETAEAQEEPIPAPEEATRESPEVADDYLDPKPMDPTGR